MDETDVRVIAPDVGGAFGLKIGIYPEDILACLLAIDTRRPVKWIEDRTEHFRGAAHAREAVHALTLGGRRATARFSRCATRTWSTSAPITRRSGPPLLTELHVRRARTASTMPRSTGASC